MWKRFTNGGCARSSWTVDGRRGYELFNGLAPKKLLKGVFQTVGPAPYIHVHLAPMFFKNPLSSTNNFPHYRAPTHFQQQKASLVKLYNTSLFII
jgi:hypothetical protein